MTDETAKKIACALITAMGMQAANQARLSNGMAIAYDESGFDGVIKYFRLDEPQHERTA